MPRSALSVGRSRLPLKTLLHMVIRREFREPDCVVFACGLAEICGLRDACLRNVASVMKLFLEACVMSLTCRVIAVTGGTDD